MYKLVMLSLPFCNHVTCQKNRSNIITIWTYQITRYEHASLSINLVILLIVFDWHILAKKHSKQK